MTLDLEAGGLNDEIPVTQQGTGIWGEWSNLRKSNGPQTSCSEVGTSGMVAANARVHN